MARLVHPACLLLVLGGLALLAPLASAQNPSPNADLAITKQASPNPVVVGQQTTFYLNMF